MSKFLEELAASVYQAHGPDLHHVTLVFPNRRAGLFFRKHLSALVTDPVWAPEVLTFEEFVISLSDMEEADQLTLIFELYRSFIATQTVKEPFEKFYFWGEMLVNDFNELDKYLVDPEKLFVSIKDQKELDEAFLFLDEREKRIIRSFWASFLPDASPTQYSFLKTWEILLPVYQDFVQKLKQNGTGYQGLIYRQVAEDLNPGLYADRQLVFAGFNALTSAEAKILRYFVKGGEEMVASAELHWDLDQYYFEDEKQEAGIFMRQYAKDPVLGATFPKEKPDYLKEKPKDITVTGVSLEVGQAKALSELLQEQAKEGKLNTEETVVVLPREYMLFPLLNSLPEAVEKINVTMGYPLRETPLYSLLESMLTLQATLRTRQQYFNTYYHQPVTAILSHPYLVQAFPAETTALLEDIRKENKVMIPAEDLTGRNELLDSIFQKVDSNVALCRYLADFLRSLYGHIEEAMDPEREYVYHFYQITERLREIISKQQQDIEVEIFLKLFRQIARSVKIPFNGEPLEGLQIMGLLETRNLDFKHVIILSMNEGDLPADSRNGSFIPYNIRKAFGLPTFEDQDAIFSYLFYRLIQRAEKVNGYYNVTADFGLSGEVSRYVRQLQLESGITVEEQVLANAPELSEPKPISVQKDSRVLAALGTYLEGQRNRFSPSALNIYLDCRLKFYFRYVAKLYEPSLVQEEMDAAMFGNILHGAMEIIYKDHKKKTKTSTVLPTDFFILKTGIDGAINKAIRDYYHIPGKEKMKLEGRNLIMYEVMKDFMEKVLDYDQRYAPFEVIALEGGSRQGYKLDFPLADGRKVALKGIIDRIDRKDGMVRVIDYKSGKDDREIRDKERFFDRKYDSRNKAAMQTFYYAMLYINKHGTDEPVRPGLFNMREMFRPDFSEVLLSNGNVVEDVRPYMESFRQNLGTLLEEIYDEQVPFDQTDKLMKCQWCEYNGICRRE